MARQSILARVTLALVLAVGFQSLIPMAIPEAHAASTKDKKLKKHVPLHDDGTDGAMVSITTINPVEGESFTPICPATTSSTLVDIFNVYRAKKGSFSIFSYTPPADEPAVYDLTADNKQLTLNGGNTVTVTMQIGAQETEGFVLTGYDIVPHQIRVQRRPKSDGTTFSPWFIPVNVWEFDKVVDYNALHGELPGGVVATDLCNDVSNPSSLVSGSAKTTCGAEPEGVATDGATRILLRLKTAKTGAACFKVVTGADDNGKTDPEDSSSIATASDVSNPYWAFGTYISPDAFGNHPSQEEREIEVEVAFTPGTSAVTSNTLAIRKKIKLKRPPVLLVHGVWADSDTWGREFQCPWCYGPKRTLRNMDYGATNAYSFASNIPLVGQDIKKLLTEVRSKNIAVTQTDVIAHSMGGMLTRGWIASGNYRRSETFGDGDVHRLITLSTPQYGSQLANLIINAENSFTTNSVYTTYTDIPNFGVVPVYHYPLREMEHAIRKWMGELKNGAVCDLAENSTAIATPGAADVETRAYTASKGPIGDLLWPVSSAASEFYAADDAHQLYNTHIVPYLFTAANDGIVLQTSQQGGVPANASENEPDLIHFHRYIPTGITKSGDLGRSIYANDLDSQDHSRFAALPPVTSTGLGDPVQGRGTTIDQANYTAQCTAATGLPPMKQH